MKFIKKLLFILSLPIFIGVKGYSQVNNSVDSLHTFRSSKINVDLLGVTFQRESPLGYKSTLVLRAGVSYNFGLTSGRIAGDSYRYRYNISPVITSGIRHYYRLSPVSAQLKQNIGNFIGVDVGVKAVPLVSKNLSNNPLLFLLPYWGIQRRIGGSGSFELGLGLTVKHIIDDPDTRTGLSPNRLVLV